MPTPETTADYVYQPTRVLESVADIIEEIKTGKPSNRLNSPVFARRSQVSIRPGDRHQTAGLRASKPRVRAPMTR